MTEDDLQAIRERLANATPGPWKTIDPITDENYFPSSQCICTEDNPTNGVAVFKFVKDTPEGHIHTEIDPHNVESGAGRAITGNYDWEAGGILRLEDTEFIAHAPEDIAALLAEVEKLKAKLKKLSTLPTVEAKGPNDTDAGRFLIAARNLEDGEYIGGSCTRRAVASLIRRDVDIALNGEES